MRFVARSDFVLGRTPTPPRGITRPRGRSVAHVVADRVDAEASWAGIPVERRPCWAVTPVARVQGSPAIWCSTLATSLPAINFPACDGPDSDPTYPLQMWLCSNCGLAQLVGEPIAAEEPLGL